MQWGTVDYHKQSLENLKEAMRRTRKLCAVMVDTIGRELIINREAKLDERGWPVHEGQPIAVTVGDKVCSRQVCMTAAWCDRWAHM